MITSSRLFCYGILLILLPTLTACSSLTRQTKYSSAVEQATLQDEDSTFTLEELSYLTMQSEDSLTEELKELDKTGSWDTVPAVAEKTTPPESIYDFPIIINKQVQFYIDQFQGRKKKTFARWLALSKKYQSFIEKELEKAGLPKDLVFLAMIESGFNTTAYSRAHAAGLWQFIPGTGKRYGLRIDKWVDERREPEKATLAAIQYLLNLYEEFADWYLAVAAYNAGEGRIRKAIRKYKTRDFWEIADHRHLSLETKRYVPKLIAAIIVGREPAKYGFTNIDSQSPLEYDQISVPPGTDLAAIAVSAATTVKQLRTLNAELRRDQTPPGSKQYHLRIPKGTHALVSANLQRLHPIITTKYKTHTVRSGESLTAICRKYRINKNTLLKANRLRTPALKKGQRLRIPYRTTQYILLKKGETPETWFAQAGKEGRLVLHELKRGETLSGLSQKYNVPVHIIQQWNNIKNVRRIRAGDHIALYLGTTSPAAPRLEAAKKNTEQEGVSPLSKAVITLRESKKNAPGTKGNLFSSSSEQNPQVVYQVRNGDSLWAIARRFQVSASQIRQWNNLAGNTIHPGTRLVIRKG